jgi:hypothetical protein
MWKMILKIGIYSLKSKFKKNWLDFFIKPKSCSHAFDDVAISLILVHVVRYKLVIRLMVKY